MSINVLISEWGSWDEFMGERKKSPPILTPPTLTPAPPPPQVHVHDQAEADERYRQEIADKYEEIRNMYKCPVENPRLTTDQLATIRKMWKDGYLSKADFPTPHKFHKKRKLLMEEADILIKLGIQKQKEWKVKQESEIGLRWKIY